VELVRDALHPLIYDKLLMPSFFILGPFEAFLKEYIWKNAYKSIDTECFQEMFIEHFKGTGKSALIQDIDWDHWLYTPGIPHFEPQ